MPVPIFLPVGGGGGPFTLFDVFVVLPIVVLCLVELIQVVVASIRLFDPSIFDDGEYKSVYEYLYWWIPVLPPLRIFISKLCSLGKKNKEC
jgi:hypothetical protein